ncbi:hypothetical protein ACTMS2_12770 [Micromonospora sp. SD12]
MTEQIGAAQVHPAVVEACRLGSTGLLLSLPYLVGQSVAFAMTAPNWPPGISLWWGYVALGEFVVLLSVALGWFVGKLLSPVFAALVAALGWVLLVVIVNLAPGNIVLRGRPEMMVNTVGLGVRILAVGTLLAALAWLPLKPPSNWRIIQAWPSVVAALAVVFALSAVGTLTPRNPVQKAVACASEGPRICVWPEQRKYLPELREVSERVRALPAAFQWPVELNAVGLKQQRQLGSNGEVRVVDDLEAPTFEIIQGSIWSYSGSIASAIQVRTFQFADADACAWNRLTPSDERRLLVLDAWLEGYLAGSSRPDYRTDAPAEIQQAWEEGWSIASEKGKSDQFSWAEREVVDLRGRYCK